MVHSDIGTVHDQTTSLVSLLSCIICISTIMSISRWFPAILMIVFVESAVLDPALYLSPSPPMTPTSDSISPGELWTQSIIGRRERDAENFVTPEDDPTSTEPKEMAGRAKSFWPLRSIDYSLRGIHIPMTFSISGAYGSNNGGYAPGVLGSSYASVSGDSFGNYGKSTLAGTGYGNYGEGYPGVRIFGGSAKTAWSGWGNGKWGHYGKG